MKSFFPVIHSVNYGVHISTVVEESRYIGIKIMSLIGFLVMRSIQFHIVLGLADPRQLELGDPYLRLCSVSLMRILTFWGYHGYKM